MRSYVSYPELDELGEALIKDYIKKTKQRNVMCVDIEGFVTGYLGLKLVYESFAEEDSSKIGFMSDGVTPLKVWRKNKPTLVVFPEFTVVLDRFLLHDNESGRHRFTLAHEGAHKILAKHNPMQMAAFCRVYDSENNYSPEDIKRMFSLGESQADRLGATLIMPRFIVEKVLKKFSNGRLVKIYGGSVFAPEDKITLQKMADCMGVPFTALIIRLRNLKMLEQRDLSEYIESNLQFGGVL